MVLQVVLFRPRQRERKFWVERLRESGHDIKFVHDPERIGEQANLVVIDTMVERWKDYVRMLQGQAAPIVLLVEDKANWSNEEMGAMGIAGVITTDEEPASILSASKEESKNEPQKHHLGEPVIDLEMEKERCDSLEIFAAIPLSRRRPIQKKHAVEVEGQLTVEEAFDEVKKEESSSIDPEIEGPITEPNHAVSLTENRALPSVAAVYAAKGGVGKTVFLLHLGALLAKSGYRVCILDLDLMHGTVASTLQLYPDHTIADLIDNIDHPNAAKACLYPVEMGFSIVAAPREPRIAALDRETLQKIILLLTTESDFVLVDTSVHFDGITRLALERADRLLLMSTGEKASIHALVRMVPLITKLHPSPEISLIWNRLIEPVPEGERDLFPWPMMLQLPETPAVAQAVRSGAMTATSARSNYLTEVQQLVNRWTGEDTAKTVKRRSLLGRLIFGTK